MHRGLTRKWLRPHWWLLWSPGRTSSSRTLELSYGVMRPDQATIWYRRMSIVYALGAWSVLGSAIFLTRKPKMSGRILRQDRPRSRRFLTVFPTMGKMKRMTQAMKCLFLQVKTLI
ncbi:small integral membrane protein 26 isoform X1 [Rattus norvegicus]|uniref:small integral membrane protein 26 isoform X1 n=1 Tax=Rattus norvegicus TaxID=10116 RepID=UPI0003D0FAC0|nr:small integral membrane protein 26 isoform X1 [Rattus norvegicus]|eukprot:XP_006235187.1 PREDICTED: uncharacterized protein LOC296207 isoform X1 [Rattus norvegicus]